MSSILEVKSLNLIIDNKHILKDISFSLEKGSFTVLCGKNGSGKSMLLKIIKGLRSQTSGSIIISGEDLSNKRSKRLNRAGLVFQNATLSIVGESVEKDIEFGLENLSLSDDEVKRRTTWALDLFKLNELKDLRPSLLSGGEIRRLAIASVVAMKADFILLDEPFTALDYPSTLKLIDTLIELNNSGITIVVVSHEVEKFLSHTSNVIILNEGRIVFDGKAKDSLESLKKSEIYLPDLEFEKLTWKR